MNLYLEASDDDLKAKLSNCSTYADVADLLEVHIKTLTYLLRGNTSGKNYKVFTIKKKSGSTRTICAPTSTLKILQMKLNYILSLIYVSKPSTHGFVIGKSILTNAQTHLRKTFVLNVDIKDFFPSINFGRVRGMLMASPYNLHPKAATIITQICCYSNELPQGAPSSPVLSNMICAKLDSQLQRLAKEYKSTYTRYADDITFSTTRKPFPEGLAKASTKGLIIGESLKNTILSNGFIINEAKTRLSNKTQRLEVTGLTVNKFPNVRRTYIRQIRAMLHAWEKYGIDNAQKEHFEKYDIKNRNPESNLPKYQEIIRGKINFLGMIRGNKNKIYIDLAERFNKLADAKFTMCLRSPIEHISSALWVLESDENISQGTGFMLEGLGLVTCLHVLGDPTNVTKAFQTGTNKKYPVKILRSDKSMDIAILEILEIDSPDYTYLKVGDSSKLELTSTITVAGFPNYSDGDSAYFGIGNVTSFRNSLEIFLVSASIVYGNSGGPVLDSENRVVGIAVRGAKDFENAAETEKHGVIPINRVISNGIFSDLVLKESAR